MENLSKKQILIIGGIILIILIVVGYYFFNNIKNINYDFLEDDKDEIDISKENVDEIIEEKEKIIVHIAGAVNKEGIVVLDEEARIIDAITAAGGLKQDVDLTDVNLAYILSDGQKIYIPHVNDENKATVDSENGENVVKDTMQGTTNKNSLININTANVTQLGELPGVGSSTAQKIITYRNENGKFKTIEELKNVSGIGEAKYNNIKDYICVK